jgi:histone H3/H4
MAATAVITPVALPQAPSQDLAPAPAPALAPAAAATPSPAPAAQPAEASSESSEGGRHVDPLNYKTYIHKIAKQCHPDMNVSAEVEINVNYLLVEFAKSVIRTADAMAKSDKTLTLNLKEIKASLPGLLPDELLDHALDKADEAVRRIDPKLLEGAKRRNSKSPQSAQPSPAQGVDPAQPAAPSPAPAPTPAPIQPAAVPASPAPATPKVARSTKAGLIIPISRVDTMIRQLCETKRVGAGAPIYLAAVMDYLATEVLDLTGNATRDDRIVTLKLRHLMSALCYDAPLRRVFGYWIVEQQLLQAQAKPSA